MPSPLPFSPVGQPVLPPSFVPSSPGSVSVTSSITSISPGKRKADPRIFDVPIERPSKKMKKKKTKLLVSILLIISNYYVLHVCCAIRLIAQHTCSTLATA